MDKEAIRSICKTALEAEADNWVMEKALVQILAQTYETKQRKQLRVDRMGKASWPVEDSNCDFVTSWSWTGPKGSVEVIAEWDYTQEKPLRGYVILHRTHGEGKPTECNCIFTNGDCWATTHYSMFDLRFKSWIKKDTKAESTMPALKKIYEETIAKG